MSWIAVPPPIRNPQSAIRNRLVGFRWTIKRKLLALGGATVLPLALVFALWVRWEVREHEEGIEAELRVVSQQAAGQVQEFIEPVRELVMTLASLPPVRNLEAGPTQDLLRRFKSGFHRLANVFVYSADGRFIASAVSRPGTTPPTPTDRRWFRQELETGRPVVSDFLIGRVVGEPVIVVAAPVRDPGEAPRAVVAASVTLRRLQDHFLNLPLGPGRTLLLVDAEGKVLAGRGEGGRPAGSAQESGPIGRQVPDALRDPASPTLLGVPVLSAVAPVPGTAWRVLAALPRATVEAMVWKEMRAIALPALGILGVVALVGFVIARSVWIPLGEVAGAVRGFGAGRYVPAPARSSDEVGEIAAAFNAMVVAVQQRTQESQALFEVSKAITATLGLEEVLDRILEKTAELLRVERAWVLLIDAATQDLAYSRSLGFGSDAFEAQRLQPGEGVAGRAVMEQAPAQSADILVDPAIRLSPETRERVTQQGIRAALAVPFISGGEVLGALAVGDPGARRFREDEVQLLWGLASAAAVALKNARLYEAERVSRARAEALGEETRRHLEEVTNLGHIARAITSQLDLDRVLATVTEAARALLGCEMTAVATCAAPNAAAAIATSAGREAGAFRELVIEPGRGLGGKALATRAPAWTEDYLGDARLTSGYTSSVAAMGIRGSLCVPLLWQGDVIGLLWAMYHRPYRFSPPEIRSLERLADIAAIAVQNARLYAEAREARDAAQRQRDRAFALAEVGRLIVSSLDLNQILDAIVEKARDLLGTHSAEVWSLDPETRGLRVVRGVGLSSDYLAIPDLEMGEGVNGRAVAEVCPVWSNDVQVDPSLRYRPETLEQRRREGIHAALAFPILTRGGIFGSLAVSTSAVRDFTSSDVDLMMSLAQFAGIALDNARLLEAERQSRAQAEALAEVAQALIAVEGEDQVLDRIIERARVLFDTNECAILLAGTGEAEGRLVVRRGKGPWAEILAPGPTAYTLAPGEGVGGLAYARGTPVWTPDNLNDPAILLPPWLREVLQEFRMRAALSVPLMGSAGPIGVMTVNRPTGHRFTPAEVGLLQRFAALAAIGLRQEALRAETRRHLEEVSNLGNVAREITSQLDLERVLEVVAEAVRRLLGCDLSTLAICAEPNGPATVRTGAGHKVGVWHGNVVEPGLGLGGRVLLTRAPAWTEDYLADPSNTWDYADLMAAEGMRANLAVPLLWQSHVIGVLWAISRSPYRFTPAEVRTLERLADVAAIAIQNARLYAEIRAQAEMLEQRVRERTAELEATNAQLVEASRAKSAFLANMSHELRTPLHAILGFTEILLGQEFGALSDAQGEFLTEVHASGHHLVALINDVLDLAKVEAGKVELRPEPFDLGGAIAGVCTNLRTLATEKQLQVTLDTEEALPPLVADPDRIKQVLYNLLSNAIKFTPEGGTVTVSARRRAISDCRLRISDFPGAGGGGRRAERGEGIAEGGMRIAELPGAEGGMRRAESSGPGAAPLADSRSAIRDPQSAMPAVESEARLFIEISVADTGIGIAPEAQRRIFEAFEQGEVPGLAKPEGTGLGLAVTRQLVELHGGTIRVASPGLGQGSTFTVMLPAGPPGGRPGTSGSSPWPSPPREYKPKGT